MEALMKVVMVGGGISVLAASIGAFKWFWWALFVLGPWVAVTGAIAWFIAVVFGKS